MSTPLIAQLLLGMPFLVGAVPAPDYGNGGIVYGEAIETGIVIAEGEVLAAPYQVGTRRGEVFVNSKRVAVLSVFRPAFGRRSRWSAPPENRRLAPAVAMLVAAIERHLVNDEALLVFDQHTRVFCGMDTAVGFLNGLVRANSVEKRIFVALATDLEGAKVITTAQWREALSDFKPSEELNRFLADHTESGDEDSEDDGEAYTYVNQRETNARRMYVLSTLGMVLAVLSLGMLLTGRPESAGRWSQVADSEPRLQLIGRCLLLIVVLQAFDLLCTLIVGSTGHIEELNPLAGLLVATPAALAAFKLAATALGTGILWSLRRYVGAQLASWWLCLLLTILTARWVTVQSLFFT